MTGRIGVGSGVGRRGGIAAWSPLALDSKLLAWWDPADYAGGTTWTGKLGNVANKTGTVLATTQGGFPAVNYGAGAGYFNCPTLQAPTEGMAIAAHVKLSTTSTAAMICATGSAPGSGLGMSSHVNGDGKREAFIKGNTILLDGATTLAAETWILTIDSAPINANAVLLINGVSQALGISICQPIAPDAGFTLGARSSDGQLPMRGLGGHVVFATELTEDELAELVLFMGSRW